MKLLLFARNIISCVHRRVDGVLVGYRQRIPEANDEKYLKYFKFTFANMHFEPNQPLFAFILFGWNSIQNGNIIRIECVPCCGAKEKLPVPVCHIICAVSSFWRGLVWCYIFILFHRLFALSSLSVSTSFFVVMLMVIFLFISISVMPMLCTELYNEDFSLLLFLFSPTHPILG